MVSNRRPTKLRLDSDGVKMETSGLRLSVWLVVVTLALIGAFLLVRPGRQRKADERLAAAYGSHEAASILPRRGPSAAPAA